MEETAYGLKTKTRLDMASAEAKGNPQLAAQALQSEQDVGLLLPCNVVVYQDDGDTVVAALDPATMVDLTDNRELESVAREARSRLERVLEAMTPQNHND